MVKHTQTIPIKLNLSHLVGVLSEWAIRYGVVSSFSSIYEFIYEETFWFLLSSFIVFWDVCFYVKETNIINHVKFFERGATPAGKSKEVFSKWGPASKVMAGFSRRMVGTSKETMIMEEDRNISRKPGYWSV